LKKWLIISSVLVVCFLVFVAGAYIRALQPKNEAADIALATAEEKAGIEKMDEFYLYNGHESYSVVVGTTSGGDKQIVWIPENDKQKVVVEHARNGKSKEDILSKVKKNRNPAEIVSVKLGMEKNVPLWEVTYLDESNSYNYDYYDFKTGEWLKYYRSI